MNPIHFTKLPALLLIATCLAQTSNAATLANRWSFDTDTTDSVGANPGVLIGGATVTGGQLTLTGLGTGPTANHMTFTTPIGIGANFGAFDDTGVSVETWYTDTGTGTWGKLFHFGTNLAGQELAYTHSRGNGELSGVDRSGAKLFGEQIAQNQEHHLVITVSVDGNMNAWVDGVRKVTNSDTNDLSNVGTQFEGIGATNWGDPGMTGTVNEFRIWNGTLADFEVAQNFEAGPDTVPVVADSDTDGLPDSWELAQNGITNLTQLNGTLTGPGPGAGTGDFDGDQLSDLQEFTRETDPVDNDTDDDGLLDGAEVITHLTDPKNPDTDGDTLTDGSEVNIHNSSPLLKDTDMDFYDDNVEVANGTLPNDPNSPPPFTGVALAHRWSFTTGAAQLTDSVGGNTAVLYGDPEFIGNQIVFDGLEIGPDADSFGFTDLINLGANYGPSGVSFESWYTDNSSGNWSKLFSFGNGQGGSNINFNLQRGGDNVSSIQYDGTDFSNETRPAVDVEHHLALTITPSGEVNAWVDGAHVNGGVVTNDGNNLGTITSTFERVGASAWNDAAMSGSINEFRIWKGTLTPENVAENFAIGPDSLIGEGPLSISSISRNRTSGAVTLTFRTIAGRKYRIDRSPALLIATDPGWLDVEDQFIATGEISTFTDQFATGARLFYRIEDVTNK